MFSDENIGGFYVLTEANHNELGNPHPQYESFVAKSPGGDNKGNYFLAFSTPIDSTWKTAPKKFFLRAIVYEFNSDDGGNPCGELSLYVNYGTSYKLGNNILATYRPIFETIPPDGARFKLFITDNGNGVHIVSLFAKLPTNYGRLRFDVRELTPIVENPMIDNPLGAQFKTVTQRSAFLFSSMGTDYTTPFPTNALYSLTFGDRPTLQTTIGEDISVPSDVATPITWTTPVFDTDAMFNPSDPTNIYINTTGYYDINVRVPFSGTTEKSLRSIDFFVSGNLVTASRQLSCGALMTDYVEFNMRNFKLNAGQYITITVTQQSGTTLTIKKSYGYSTWLSIKKV